MRRESELLALGNARDSKVYRLFLRYLPKHQSPHFDCVLDVSKIAEDIGISDKAIYRWFNDDYIPGGRVYTLINLKGSKLTAEMLLPYTIRN